MDELWGSGITRESLLQKIVLLTMIGRTSEPPQRHLLVSLPDDPRHLTIDQEAEIAGNLAFLARRSLESHNVAAIGIEEDGDGQGMVIRVTVNGTMLSSVVQGLNKICCALESAARCENVETHNIELLLQQVVEIDFRRIATRLRLNNKYTLSSSPLFRVQKVLEKVGVGTEMLDQVRMLLEINRELKRLPLHRPQQASYTNVSRLIQHIHDLVFLHGLTSVVSQIDRGSDTARAIDSLQKLGHYYRATRQLVKAARRKNCHLFRNIRVMSFDIEVPATVRKRHKCGESIALLSSLMKEVERAKLLARFQGSDSTADSAITKKLNEARSGLKIHAEIKLLLFYECHPQPRQPRLIAASKSSCYLCDQFCRIQGSFQVLATYGTFNERWLLPDWIKPPSETRLDESVREFDKKLDTLLLRQLQDTERRPLHIESLVGLSASWPSLKRSSDSKGGPTETGPETEATIAETTSVLSSSDSQAEHEIYPRRLLTSSSCCRVNPASRQSTTSIIELSIGDLPFSHWICPNQESIRVVVDDLLLIFEFLQESSGTLQIRRGKAKSWTDCGPVIDVWDIPINVKLPVACSKDSSQLNARPRSTNDNILILTFD